MLAGYWSSRPVADKVSEKLPHTDTLTGKMNVHWRNLAFVWALVRTGAVGATSHLCLC